MPRTEAPKCAGISDAGTSNRNLELFFGLFVFSLDATPFAILIKFDFALDLLLVLARPIIGAFALTAIKFD